MQKEFNLGRKIKDLRIQKNMNAKELAHMSKISVGMLSQLESGSTQGSVDTLRKIAKVLDTTLAHLFTEDNEEVNTLVKNDESLYIVRKANRKKISFPDSLYTSELLVPNLQGDIEFTLVRLSSNRISEETVTKEKSEQCIYILDGEIVVTIDKKEYILQKRDSLRLDRQIPHKIENKSLKKASYISAITPVSL